MRATVGRSLHGERPAWLAAPLQGRSLSCDVQSSLRARRRIGSEAKCEEICMRLVVMCERGT